LTFVRLWRSSDVMSPTPTSWSPLFVLLISFTYYGFLMSSNDFDFLSRSTKMNKKKVIV
jgi:hypothetical protein